MLALDAKPNAAHLKLAELEAKGKLKAVVTQNIDGLHQAAGSKNVLELHGSVYRNYCRKCGKLYDAQYIKNSAGVPMCSCGGQIKPDVVLYEEGLDSSTHAGSNPRDQPGRSVDHWRNKPRSISGSGTYRLLQR